MIRKTSANEAGFAWRSDNEETLVDVLGEDTYLGLSDNIETLVRELKNTEPEFGSGFELDSLIESAENALEDWIEKTGSRRGSERVAELSRNIDRAKIRQSIRQAKRRAEKVDVPTIDIIEDGLFDESKTVGTDQLTPDDSVDLVGDVDATGLDQLTPDEDQEVDEAVEVSTAEPISPQIIAPGDTIQARRRRALALSRRRQTRKPVSRRKSSTHSLHDGTTGNFYIEDGNLLFVYDGVGRNGRVEVFSLIDGHSEADLKYIAQLQRYTLGTDSALDSEAQRIISNLNSRMAKSTSRRQKTSFDYYDEDENPSYSTADDAKWGISQALGEWFEDYDIDAIFEAVYEWDGRNFVQTVSTEEFWQIVERFDKTASRVSRRKPTARRKTADVYLTGDILWEGALEDTQSVSVGDYDIRTVAEELARELDIPEEDFDAFVSYAVSKADFADYQTGHETLKLSDGSEVTVVLEDDGMDYFSNKSSRRKSRKRIAADEETDETEPETDDESDVRDEDENDEEELDLITEDEPEDESDDDSDDESKEANILALVESYISNGLATEDQRVTLTAKFAGLSGAAVIDLLELNSGIGQRNSGAAGQPVRTQPRIPNLGRAPKMANSGGGDSTDYLLGL